MWQNLVSQLNNQHTVAWPLCLNHYAIATLDSGVMGHELGRVIFCKGTCGFAQKSAGENHPALFEYFVKPHLAANLHLPRSAVAEEHVANQD
jgi:hypothetical protein